MNKRQKRTLQTILAVLVLMFLFPPFHEPLGPGVMENSGFSFILMPPESDSRITPSINSLQLIAQCFGVAVIGAVAYFLGQGQDSTPRVTRTNWSAVLVEAFRRSKIWLWVGLAFIVMPVFWARDSHSLAIKLIGNTGAALLIYACAFSWHMIRVLRSLPAASEKPPVRTSFKRIVFATILCAVGVLVLFASKPRQGSAPWERDWSSSKREISGEVEAPGLKDSDSSWWRSDPEVEPGPPGHSKYLTDEEVVGTGQMLEPATSEHINWRDFTPVTPENPKQSGQVRTDQGTKVLSIDEFLDAENGASGSSLFDDLIPNTKSNTSSNE